MAVIGPDTPGKVWGEGSSNLVFPTPTLNTQRTTGANQHKQWSSMTLGLICRQTTTS